MSIFPAYDRCTRCQARRAAHVDGYCPSLHLRGARWSQATPPECGHDVKPAPGCEQCDAKKVRASTGIPIPESHAPVLSDVGRPLVCPSCGGASVYARHLAMEGRACRHTTRGNLAIAFYCGEHERRRVAFDADLPANVTSSIIEGWNGEILEAVKSLAEWAKRDVREARAAMAAAMEHVGAQALHIRELEAELSKKVATLADDRALLADAKRRRRNAARRKAAK